MPETKPTSPPTTTPTKTPQKTEPKIIPQKVPAPEPERYDPRKFHCPGQTQRTVRKIREIP